MDKNRKALGYLNWPYWYQPCLVHLNSLYISQNRISEIQFYHSAMDTFVRKDEIEKMISNDDELEIFEDLMKDLEKGEQSQIEMLDEQGTGLIIDTYVYLIITKKNGKDVEPEKELVEENYKKMPYLKASRQKIGEVVKDLVSKLDEEKKKPTEPKLKSDTKDWKTLINENIQNYYTARSVDVKNMFNKYIKEIINDKSNNEFLSIRTQKHSPRIGSTRTGIVEERKIFIQNENKSYEGKLVLLDRNLLTVIDKNSKKKDDGLTEFRNIAKKNKEAKDYEIDETFRVFFETVFGNSGEIYMDGWTITKENSKKKPTIIDEKTEQIKNFVPEDTASIKEQTIVLPLVFSNRNRDSLNKGIAEAERLENMEKNTKVVHVQGYVKTLNETSKPQINKKILDTRKAEMENVKSLSQIKNSKKISIDEMEECSFSVSSTSSNEDNGDEML